MNTRHSKAARAAAWVVTLAMWSYPLHSYASQGGTSPSTGSNANASSGGSSNNSNASSDNSNASSQNTNNSSKSNSSQNSQNNTTSSSSNTGGVIIGVSVLVLLVGLSVWGTYITMRAASPEPATQPQALQRLQDYLQRNHALVVRDVMRGEGELLNVWNSELGLTAIETRALRAQLRRASMQKRLLSALGGTELTLASAQAFATAYSEAFVAALPKQRPHNILQAKLGF